jgi:hypothetical protein
MADDDDDDDVYGLNLLTGALSGDVVAIYDTETFTQLFPDARPIKATVRETSKVMEHPVETGAMIADHHIINPTEIELSLIISSDAYATAYQQIYDAFVNATNLSVQTRTDVYDNMVVMNVPHEEAPEMYDAIAVALHLREVLFVVPASVAASSTSSATPAAPANYAPADPANSDTVQSGLQAPATPANVPQQYGATGSW